MRSLAENPNLEAWGKPSLWVVIRDHWHKRRGAPVNNLLGTALLLGALYLAFVWLTETEIFSTDIRFNIHSDYGATLGGRR